MFLLVKEKLLASKMCSTCSKWIFQAAETWGLKYDLNNGKFTFIFIQFM